MQKSQTKKSTTSSQVKTKKQPQPKKATQIKNNAVSKKEKSEKKLSLELLPKLKDEIVYEKIKGKYIPTTITKIIFNSKKELIYSLAKLYGISGKKIKVVEFIFNNLNMENQLTLSQKQIIEKTKISLKTVNDTFKHLSRVGLIQKDGLIYTVNINIKNKNILINFTE